MSQTPPQIQYVEAPPRGLSIASLVIGLVSILLGFSLIVPLAGLILGILGAKREPAGKGMAIAGIVINAIILAFTRVKKAATGCGEAPWVINTAVFPRSR